MDAVPGELSTLGPRLIAFDEGDAIRAWPVGSPGARLCGTSNKGSGSFVKASPCAKTVVMSATLGCKISILLSSETVLAVSSKRTCLGRSCAMIYVIRVSTLMPPVALLSTLVQLAFCSQQDCSDPSSEATRNRQHLKRKQARRQCLSRQVAIPSQTWFRKP